MVKMSWRERSFTRFVYAHFLPQVPSQLIRMSSSFWSEEGILHTGDFR